MCREGKEFTKVNWTEQVKGRHDLEYMEKATCEKASSPY